MTHKESETNNLYNASLLALIRLVYTMRIDAKAKHTDGSEYSCHVKTVELSY